MKELRINGLQTRPPPPPPSLFFPSLCALVVSNLQGIFPVTMLASTRIVEINLANPKCRGKFNSQPKKENITKGWRQKRFFVNEKSLDAKKWILCEQVHEIEKLQKIQTFGQASIIRIMATDLQDIEILTKVSGGEVISIKAECLTRLKYRCRSFQRKLRM